MTPLTKISAIILFNMLSWVCLGQSKEEKYWDKACDYSIRSVLLEFSTDSADIKEMDKCSMYAVKFYSKVIEINPKRAEAYERRAEAKNKSCDYRGAIKDYDKYLEFNSKDGEAYYSRGDVKMELSDYYGALKDFNRAIKINPKRSPFYYDRGLCKLNLGNLAGACEDWGKAGELGLDLAYDLIKKYCNN